MDSEIRTFVFTWSTAVACLIYCHQIAARLPAGAARLISLIPVVYLFTVLPFRLTAFHIAGPTFLYLVWLGNFKILLFAAGQPPLAADPPLSILHFIAFAIFPIKQRSTTKSDRRRNSPFQFLLKCLLLAAIVKSYDYRDLIHPFFIVLLYCCHVYLGVELVLAITAAPVRAVLGLDLEPQFDEPYLATSLQDFWGRRWNLMVSGILRPTVYFPVRRAVGGDRGRAAAFLATFLVSGLMHELIYYYLTRVRPTWEVTWFFVLHGFCVVTEVWVKKTLIGRWRLPTAVSRLLTLGFVAVTGWWLFFPQVVRSGVDLKAIGEYRILVRFITGGD
ncbi:long-chain-alcohol O-fatty-acyltransferase-like [Andrographis paniculata]|uniref:long-chain-alcohol O-fatty-acyltransferase-like n=1 Tax=Andrographis paniculata TaxID=175694 RepID=UPI0021E97B41|nr:long-chain-alcohol O-fatty-acyltransferase-like [Andrographis paniculata]